MVKIELDPKGKQGDLHAALAPIANKLLTQFKIAQVSYRDAGDKSNEQGAKDAKERMDALDLFKHNMGVFQRQYSFLSQIFDYGNTDIEKRSIFYRRLIPLLEFGREREGVDLSKVVLTHHSLRNEGQGSLSIAQIEKQMLRPPSEVGSGSVQEKETIRLAEIIEKLNDLFTGDLTDDDQLVYVNNVIMGKLLETELLVTQAKANTKEQFAGSPDLSKALENAIMDALAAHSNMSKQALGSVRVRQGLKDILLGPGQLYEALRERGEPHSAL